MLDRLFHLKEAGTTVRTEVTAGVTTFLTMAYIIVVQPAVLQQAGMDFGAVMAATCVSAAAATLLMGLYANYPIALAPGMGENFYFTYTVVLGLGIAWQAALGVVLVEGILFMVLAIWKVREKLVNAIPCSLQAGIAAGIGVFIALIGLLHAGIVVPAQGMPLKLGGLARPDALVSLFGLAVTLLLVVRRVRGALLLGMLVTAVAALAAGRARFCGVVAAPPSMSPTFFQCDIVGGLKAGVSIIFVLLLMDVFDTVGTVVGVSHAGGFLRDGKLPRAERVLFCDAVGTVAGAVCGTSTVTSYVESTAGICAGGRTGLASVVTAGLFLLALFFSPLARMFGTGVPQPDGSTLYPITAPALIIVGSLIVSSVRSVRWDDLTEAVPAFLALVGIPLTCNIGDGIALGFIGYVAVKLFSDRGRELNWILVCAAAGFLLRFALVK